MKDFTHFQNLSITAGLGITVLNTSGEILFESSVHAAASDFLKLLYQKLDCEESCRIAFLYACYQARRFGGRYIFFAPSGLTYCAAPLLDAKGKMLSGILAGPFLMISHDEFVNFDIKEHVALSEREVEALLEGVCSVPYISPKRAHAVSEHLAYFAAAYFSQTELAESVPIQTDMFSPSAYPIDKEDELLSSISKGDIHTANAVLSDMLKQLLLHYGGNLEVFRSRVVELTVLLSRAALKGGADVNGILGLNYDYLRELDGFNTVEDIVLWLHAVICRFTEQVFDFSDAKHVDIIYKAVSYIKANFSRKLTLKEIADHLYISPQYFSRIFKEETGQTPGEYITFVRIEESKKLLRDSNINIIDIPELVGFQSQSYFTKVFKKETGHTPAQYRRENLKMQ